MKRLLALAALALIATVRASAQTLPLQTEEAATAADGTLRLEVGAQAMRNEPNFLSGEERTRADGPLLRLTWSPAATVEIDVEWTARVMAFGEAEVGDVSDWGDVALRAKVRLREPRDGGLALGARFGVTLPQTSFGNGLGPNTLRMSAQLLGSLCRAVCLHANAGLALHDEVLRAHEQRDFLHYGVAVSAPAHSALSVVAELAGLAGRGAPGAEARGEARAGLRVGRGPVQWSAAVRRGLAEADGDWGLVAGVAWTSSGR